MHKPLKSYQDVLDRIEELYNDTDAGRLKHYEAKERANIIGKHIGHVKNALVKVALGARAEHMDEYFGAKEERPALTKKKKDDDE